MTKLPIKINGAPNGTTFVKADRPKLNRELATVLARRGTLGRIAALVANERLVQVTFHADEKLYYFLPLSSSEVQNERFVLAGSSPYLPQQLGSNGNVIVPALMHESDIELGTASFQKLQPDFPYSWIDVDDSVDGDKFVNILRRWTGWDEKLTSVFEERIRCSAQYLADTYVENRPAPTRKSDYISWEQSIVEANGHPLHKCRMPVDPRTQPTRGFNFKTPDIAFFAVKREILDIHGPLEAELQPLLSLAGIDLTTIDSTEIVIPVHEFQVQFLQSLPHAAGQLRLLPERVKSMAQSSTRSMTVPELPGLGIKLSLSLIIGDNIRTINSHSAYNAVRYWTAGMLDPAKVIGLQATPLEILPETACANALGDHLAVMIRWDPYHCSRPPVDEDVGYAVTGALCEPAFIGRKGCVAESVFQLTSLTERRDFLRRYTQLYFQCFLRPLFTNGLLIDAHGQNSILRFSRLTGQLLGFSARDMSGTRFNRAHFERTTGIIVEERMLNHDLSVVDLLERAYFIFFVVHLGPLMIALDVHREKSSTTTSKRGDGFAVVARELHDAISTYENLQGEDAVSVTARELASEARKIWINAETWPLQCFISQRMRADWAHRNKSDKASHVPVPNIITFS